MSEKFTASNGDLVTLLSPTEINVSGPEGPWPLSPRNAVQALREFFLHEVGVWLDTETEALVVRCEMEDDEDGRAVVIIIDGISTVHWEYLPAGNDLRSCIRDRYFAAHPRTKALPSEPHTAWVDKYGTDIWWVNAYGVLICCASPSSDPAKYAPFTQLVKEVSHDA